MSMTKDQVRSTEEALRLALEYVELVPDDRYSAEHIDQDALITAIKAALLSRSDGEAQTRSVVKDEPLTENGMYRLGYHNGYGFGEAYGKANAPQRTWVGLTDEEIAEALGDEIDSVYMTDFRRVEAKLKEKNT